MILGLDMATKKTGFCLMNEDKTIYHYGLIRTEGSETKERMKEIYQSIKTIVEKYDIAHIVLEDVPVNNHNNLKTGKDLSILQGVILSICFENNLNYTLYNPSSWRTIIGTYNGTREGMKRDFQKRRAVEVVNEIYNLGFIYNATETKKRLTDDDKAEAILIALAYLKENENKESV